MTIEIVAVFEDGREKKIRDSDSFEEAISAALTLADAHGTDPGDGAGPPQWIQVRQRGKIEIALRILRGGLTGEKASQ